MNNDEDTLKNLFQEDESEELFLDSQYHYITDSNSKVYNGSITFELAQKTRGRAVIFADSYLELDLKVEGTLSTGVTTPISLKQSVLDLVSSVSVFNDGVEVINEQSCMFINNIRLAIENSHRVSSLEELHFALDTRADSTAQAGSDSSRIRQYGEGTLTQQDDTETKSTALKGTATSLGRQALYNKGAQLRALYFIESTKDTGTAWVDPDLGFTATNNAVSCRFYIPLMMLSEYFASLDFPIYNSAMTFVFGINTSVTGYNPFVTLRSPVNDTLTSAITAITIVSSRLAYRAVVMSPKYTSALNKRLSEGYKKEIIFETSITVQRPVGHRCETASDSGVFTLSNNVSHPTGIYLLSYPSPAVASNYLSQKAAAIVPSGRLTSAQILVNSAPYYVSPITTSYQHWKNLQTRLSPKSDFKWTDFDLHRIHFFDLSRLGSRISSPDASVTIEAEWSSVSQTQDFVGVLLRERKILLNMSSAGVVFQQVY